VTVISAKASLSAAPAAEVDAEATAGRWMKPPIKMVEIQIAEQYRRSIEPSPSNFLLTRE